MWFWKKNNTYKKEISELQNQIKDLQLEIASSRKQPIEYHFHINHVDIHNPTLEQLSFTLDQLDIEDLSGALNLGNNFGVSIGEQKNRKQNLKQKHQNEKRAIKKTKDGYSFSFHQKEE
ncbi:hypothetical protein [Bacillus taeanensis]|uniref:Uncharacterized protein n=1 Tax=Bacillus taeanensis TaxID=273032 RepID=A0A366XVC8_9BACI|nr:hypothetical protein [Bacillus taeanensis]RBW69105.1 hypothetical protein DS031_13180 [Bacillus taeanensis]